MLVKVAVEHVILQIIRPVQLIDATVRVVILTVILMEIVNAIQEADINVLEQAVVWRMQHEHVV